MEQAVEFDVPLAGIRHGQLGFLATLSPEEMSDQIPLLLDGKYIIRRRSMLSLQGQQRSFNDCVK